MIFADAHLHIFRNGYASRYGRPLLSADIDAYESLRQAHHIEAGLIVGYESEGFDPDNNAYIRSLAASRPWMVTLAYVGATSAPTPQSIAALLADGHAGIALYVMTPEEAGAALAWPAPAWGELDSKRAVISLNILPEHTQLLGMLARSYRNCAWLVSHLGLPGSYTSAPRRSDAETRLQPLLALAPFPNVFVKISGLYAVSDPPFAYPHVAAEPFMDLILERFGAERCLWASDFSPALEHVSFAQTLSFPWLDSLDEPARRAIAGANLLRLISRRS